MTRLIKRFALKSQRVIHPDGKLFRLIAARFADLDHGAIVTRSRCADVIGSAHIDQLDGIRLIASLKPQIELIVLSIDRGCFCQRHATKFACVLRHQQRLNDLLRSLLKQIHVDGADVVVFLHTCDSGQLLCHRKLAEAGWQSHFVIGQYGPLRAVAIKSPHSNVERQLWQRNHLFRNNRPTGSITLFCVVI